MKKPKVFEKTLDKTQGPQEKTQESIEKPKILGENPRSGNAGRKKVLIKHGVSKYESGLYVYDCDIMPSQL